MELLIIWVASLVALTALSFGVYVYVYERMTDTITTVTTPITITLVEGAHYPLNTVRIHKAEAVLDNARVWGAALLNDDGTVYGIYTEVLFQFPGEAMEYGRSKNTGFNVDAVQVRN